MQITVKRNLHCLHSTWCAKLTACSGWLICGGVFARLYLSKFLMEQHKILLESTSIIGLPIPINHFFVGLSEKILTRFLVHYRTYTTTYTSMYWDYTERFFLPLSSQNNSLILCLTSNQHTALHDTHKSRKNSMNI